MPETDRAFAGAIPDLYDTLLVPLIFEPYADDLAGRAARLRPRDVLETAAGTGVVPRALAPRLPAEARYTVTDLNQPMLDRARARQPEDARLVWRQADAMALPFPDASFELVLCQFGVMFLPDRVAGLAEARRVLRPGGRLLYSVWDSLATNALPETVAAAVAACFPDDPPDFLARVPHGYHDAARLRADAAAAGFASVALETVTRESVGPDAEAVAAAFCQGTPLRAEIAARGTPSLGEVTRRAARALAERHGSGRISGPIQAHVVMATK
jgi:SAM-dependent methyltransferase